MTTSHRFRLGAVAAASAVIAGGLFAAVPANAETAQPTITVSPTAFTAGDWGQGLTVSGNNFSADSAVTITITDSLAGVLAEHEVAAPVDATGNFTDTFTPEAELPALQPDETITVTATSDQGDESNAVNLVVLAKPGIHASADSVSTTDLTSAETSVTVVASGFTPGEQVAVTVEYNGHKYELGSQRAAADGSITVTPYLVYGASVAGTLTLTAVGSVSGVSQSIDVQVTGEDIVTGSGDVAPSFDSQPDPAPAAAPKLPVVSG